MAAGKGGKEPGESAQSCESAPSASHPPTFTQTVRIATTITGGVSLAVWMGGVVRELDLLMKASDARLLGEVVPASPASAPCSDERTVQALYAALLDFLDVLVDVDVISGTSAGGINGVFLALARTRGVDLSGMRDVWLNLGGFEDLLRNLADSSTPSLLYGDEWMYAGLLKYLKSLDVAAPQAPPPNAAATRLHITTTLLSGEENTFFDSMKTKVPNSDHRGVFSFNGEQLSRPDTIDALALAARSTASFPGAFEPSFVPVGEAVPASGKVPERPNMADYINVKRSHWVSDGGVLNNMPLNLVLEEIFIRPSDTDVRRVLLYVVPTTTPSTGPAPQAVDRFDEPYDFVNGLLKNVSAVMKQSIASDLTAINRHNDRVRERRRQRVDLLKVASRSSEGRSLLPWRQSNASRLLTATALSRYRTKQAAATSRKVVNALLDAPEPASRRAIVPPPPASDASSWMSLMAPALPEPDAPLAPEDLPTTPEQFATYGRPAFDGATSIALSILRGALSAASTEEDRRELLAAIGRVHAARPQSMDATALRAAAINAREQAATDQAGIADLMTTYMEQTSPTTAHWEALAAAVTSARSALRTAATSAQAALAGASTTPTDLDAANELAQYVGYLFPREGAGVHLSRLFDLGIQASTSAGAEPDQLVELVQASADTRCGLAPSRCLAQDKLTGLQLRNFGAFYKRSWRANDWMWGRLDGAGWLVRLLLDPRRLRLLAERFTAPATEPTEWLINQLRLRFALSEPPSSVWTELAWLNDPDAAPPASIRDTATWLATAWQTKVAAEELPLVAAEATTDRSPANSRTWATGVLNSGQLDTATLLSGCPVPDETFVTDATTPLMLRTLTKASATTADVLGGLPALQRVGKPLLRTIQTVTRAAYIVVRTAGGKRAPVTGVALGLAAFGLALSLQPKPAIGISGLVVALVGLYLVAILAWQKPRKTIVAIISITAVVGLLSLACKPVRHFLFATGTPPGVVVTAIGWAATEWWHPFVLVLGMLVLAWVIALLLFRPQHTPQQQRAARSRTAEDAPQSGQVDAGS